MKYFFCCLTFLTFNLQGYCQLMPVRNADSLVLKNHLKTSSSFYKAPESDDTHLIQKLTFDENGKLTSEYLLYLWDVVSYSYTNSYHYDDEGQLVEIMKIQEIHNLLPKDEDYIQSFGDAPVNEKIRLSYDGDGQLIKKEIFVFHSDHLDEGKEANQVITFEYEKGKLILEQSTSPETRVFNYNYTIRYDYDSAGNLIRKLREFGTEKPLKQETRMKYDSTGLLIEKEVIDPGAPHNNLHEKYAYDSSQQLASRYEYSEEEEDFVLESSYRYDDHGHLTAGDRDVAFEYYDNGLIKSETWTDQKSKQSITFTTTYTYY